MRNTLLFAKKEFLERVRGNAFFFTTIFFPLLMIGSAFLPAKLLTMKSKAARHFYVVCADPRLGELIKEGLDKRAQEDGRIQTVKISQDLSDNSLHQQFRRLSLDSDDPDHLDGVLRLAPDDLAAGKAEYYTANRSNLMQNELVRSALTRALQQQWLQSHGVSGDQLDHILKPVTVSTSQVTDGEIRPGNDDSVIFTPIILMLMLYMTVLVYGMAVMRSVLEEKNSKIYEVLLSTATSTQLMAGKVLGVGAVGLLQIVIWAIVGLGLGRGLTSSLGSVVKFSPSQFLSFGIFYVLGYLLYSSLYAAVGAMVNSEQEAQQFQTIVMMPLILCSMLMFPVISTPNSSLAVWVSLIPFTSPLMMYIRIIVQPPPVWQVALSVILSIATTYGLLIVCSRIYRVGILMYGKRPTLPEILKWVRYA